MVVLWFKIQRPNPLNEQSSLNPAHAHRPQSEEKCIPLLDLDVRSYIYVQEEISISIMIGYLVEMKMARRCGPVQSEKEDTW